MSESQPQNVAADQEQTPESAAPTQAETQAARTEPEDTGAPAPEGAAAPEAPYAGGKGLPVKAVAASWVRRRAGIPRSRKANRYYHAHDALIALTTGRFIETRAPMWSNNSTSHWWLRKASTLRTLPAFTMPSWRIRSSSSCMAQPLLAATIPRD